MSAEVLKYWNNRLQKLLNGTEAAQGDGNAGFSFSPHTFAELSSRELK